VRQDVQLPPFFSDHTTNFHHLCDFKLFPTKKSDQDPSRTRTNFCFLCGSLKRIENKVRREVPLKKMNCGNVRTRNLNRLNLENSFLLSFD